MEAAEVAGMGAPPGPSFLVFEDVGAPGDGIGDGDAEEKPAEAAPAAEEAKAEAPAEEKPAEAAPAVEEAAGDAGEAPYDDTGEGPGSAGDSFEGQGNASAPEEEDEDEDEEEADASGGAPVPAPVPALPAPQPQGARRWFGKGAKRPRAPPRLDWTADGSGESEASERRLHHIEPADRMQHMGIWL